MPTLIDATIAECRAQAGSRVFLVALVLILPCAAFLVGLDVAYIYGRIEGDPLPWQLHLSEEGAFAEWSPATALSIGASAAPTAS